MKEFLEKIKTSKYFDELYIMLLAIIILFSWDWFFTFGTAIVIIIASACMIIFNSFKYLIPASLFFVFSNREGFSADKFPYELLISFIILVIAIIYFMVKNKKKPNFKNYKSIIGLSLLSISCFIPIFWAKIPKETPIYYIMYLAYFFYLFIYLVFATNLDSEGFVFFKKSIIYLAILIAFECMSEIYTLKVNYPDLKLSSITFYALGWGCCNEAGIIMIMSFPFIFIDFANSKNPAYHLFTTLKLLIIGLGVTFTYSRGAYLFGILELVFLVSYTFFKTKNLKLYLSMIAVLSIIVFISIDVMFGWQKFMFDIVLNGVFNDRLNDSNRFMIWSWAINHYTKDYVTLTFGSGIVSQFEISNIRTGAVLTQVVYHSTFFEILVIGGNFGLLFLVIHFIEKYYNLRFSFKNKNIFGYLVCAYLVVDLYGFIDNTYGMYYFMIPLMIMMASYDCSNKLGVIYDE